MPEFEVIREIAQQTLTGSASSGGRDNWLWDRTCRILRNVEQISRLPEPARRATAIDRPCLIAAAYFAESGYTHSPAGQNAPASSITDITHADVCRISMQIVEKKLPPVLNGARIDKINKIIFESSDRFTTMIEAMILSDARNLEDMGTVGLLGELRRNILLGKSISDLLDSWKCKIEYGYWQARIKESFRFEPVRGVAEQRLAAAVTFMDQIAVENSAGDLKTIPETTRKP